MSSNAWLSVAWSLVRLTLPVCWPVALEQVAVAGCSALGARSAARSEAWRLVYWCGTKERRRSKDL